MLVSFGIVFLVLYKYGFPVITSMLDERKKFIEDSLRNAAEANERLAGIEKEGEAILETAREEQARILREAVQTREQLLADARRKAEVENGKMLEETRRVIRQEKDDALREVRSQIAEMSLAIAEKVLRGELSDNGRNREYTMELVNEAFAQEKDKK